MTILIEQLNTEDIDAVARLARPIWFEHYSPIIGESQVEYMLNKFQSQQAIASQISEGYQYFQVTFSDKLVGYFSLQERDRASLFIGKFYLSKNTRGKGIGRSMLAYIESLANELSCQSIDLTVNKNNPAYEIYLKLGFINQGSAQFDIGNGYIMDDYLMSKSLSRL